MTVTLDPELRTMESKRIKVSEKRQITIPKSFFEKLNLGDEVECFFRKDRQEIVIRSPRKETEFSEEILADLIEKGLSGDELLTEFKRIKAKVRPAVKQLIEEAELTVRRTK